MYPLARCPAIGDLREITDFSAYTYFLYFPGVRLDGIGPAGFPGGFPSYGGRLWAPDNLHEAEKPFDTPLMQDRCWEGLTYTATNHAGPGAFLRDYGPGPDYYSGPPSANGGANILFFDGHVFRGHRDQLYPVADSGTFVITWRQEWMAPEPW